MLVSTVKDKSWGTLHFAISTPNACSTCTRREEYNKLNESCQSVACDAGNGVIKTLCRYMLHLQHSKTSGIVDHPSSALPNLRLRALRSRACFLRILPKTQKTIVCINNGLYRDSVVMFPVAICHGIQISFWLSDLDGNSIQRSHAARKGASWLLRYCKGLCRLFQYCFTFRQSWKT